MFEPFRIAGDEGELPVAVHEAGHAVVHHGFGHRITAASIEEEPGDPARAFVLTEAASIKPALIAICAAAGPAAAFRLLGYPLRLSPEEVAACLVAEGRGDAACIATAARWLEWKNPGTQSARHVEHALALAAELIARPLVWRAIMDCAALLIRRRAEYGPQIHEVIEPHFAFGSLRTQFLEATYGEIYEVH